MKFSNLSLRNKVLIGGIIPLILMVIMGVITLTSINGMVKSNKWVTHTHEVLERAYGIVGSAVDMETGMRGFLLAGKESFLDPYKQGEKKTYSAIRSLQKTVSDNPKQVKRLEEVHTILKNWQRDVTEPAISLRRKVGDTKTMDDIASLVAEARGKKYFDSFRKLMADFSSEEERLIGIREAENASRVKSTTTIVILCVLSAIIIGLFLSIAITRSVMAQLGSDPSDIAEIANEIANGNLVLEFDDKKDTGVYADMRNMTENLSTMFKDISNGVDTLNSSSNELSTISEQMAINGEGTSDRADNVASAAEEMSANMGSVAAATEQSTANIQTIVAAIEEMSSTINEIAGNTARGSETTSKAVETAKNVSFKVDELGRAAEEINKVTDTIADISEQTNLLALNATIEAARAGEAGKGFAVVAGEIKALAQQTAEATSEINTRISDVQGTTKESVSAIESIVNIINEINSIVTTVATAIEEQSATTQEITNNVTQAATGLQEVNENVNQTSLVVDEVSKDISQMNQSTVEIKTGGVQVSSRASDLLNLAKDLDGMVSRFKV